MTRGRLAGAALAALILGWAAWWQFGALSGSGSGAEATLEEAGSSEELGVVEEGNLREASGDPVANGSSDSGKAIPASDFSQPRGRYADAKVLDRSGPLTRGYETKARYLVEGPDEVIETVLVEETYIEDPDTGETMFYRESAVVGDEFMLDADPEKVGEARLQRFMSERGLSVAKESRLSHYVSLELPRPSIALYDETLKAAREAFPDTIVSEDHIRYIDTLPNDYNGPLMWNLDQVKASDAWRFSDGSEEVVVGVVDTGVHYDHPDLMANIWTNPGETPGNGVDDDGNGFVDDVRGWDFYSDDADPMDENGHGTHISGTIGAVGDNGLGIVGANWKVKIVPIRVGAQSSLASSEITEGLRYLRALKEAGANVIASNNSYGSSNRNFVTEQEVRNHRDEGMLFVAAAGNSGENLDSSGASQYPAQIRLSNVIAVANSNQEDQLADSSNYGANSVHLAAPGEAIYSTYIPGEEYGYLSGTSMATPLVAGAAALLKSYRPTMSGEAIKERLLDTVDGVDGLEDVVISGGRLNALNALQPELRDFEIRVSNHPGAIIFLDDAAAEVEFEIETLDTASVRAEMIEPVSGGALAATGDDTFKAEFTGDGRYLVRFTADLLGIERTLDRLVVVGSPGDVTASLKHNWDFEGDGSSFRDTVGTAEAVIEGAARVDSPMGQAGDFAGANSKARFNSTFSSRVTVSGFVRNEDLDSSSHPRVTQGPHYYLYYSRDSGAPGVPDGNADTVKFLSVREDALGVWNTNPRTAVANKWVHLLASYDTRDVDNIPDVYINGAKQRVRAQSFPEGAQVQTPGASYLGDRGDGQRAWDGQFEEVRIYSSPLDAYDSMSLAARYLHSLWSGAALSGPESAFVGERLRFETELSHENGSPIAFRWSVSGPSPESFTIVEENDRSLSLDTSEEGRYSVKLEVVSEESTFVASRSVEVVGKVASGVFTSDIGETGRVWLEVKPSLTEGTITYFDSVTGNRLVREPIEIDASGLFSTVAGSPYTVTGQVNGPIAGRIEELGIEFASDASLPASGGSSFTGEYVGGGVSVGGEELELVVFDSGSALLIREGDSFEIAEGNVQSNGAFLLTASTGGQFTGSIDEEESQARGQVAGDRSYSFFLSGPEDQSEARFINLSTRGYVTPGEGALIGGFVVRGSPRSVLTRAVGPSLGSFDVPDVLEQPRIDLYEGSQQLFSGGSWSEEANASEIEAYAAEVGAFSLPADSGDAALLAELQSGIYSAVVTGTDGQSGNALLEVYDSQQAVPGYRLKNVSTRGRIDGSERTLTAGLVIRGDVPKKVLLRAAGPALEGWVEESVANPMLEIFAGSDPVASNDDWGVSESGGDSADREERLSADFLRSGAFAFESGSKDAAMVIWLEPGVYTVVASGVEGSSGIGLVEVYEAR